MTKEVLELFQTAAYFRNFSKAAEVHHLTQSTVSRQIKLLEEELGTELFIRTPKGVMLSEAGEFLIIKVRDLIEQYDAISNGIKNISNMPFPEISVVVGPLEAMLIQPVFTRLRQENPGMRFSCYTFTYKMVNVRVNAANTDLIFTNRYSLSEYDPDVPYEVVYNRPWMVAAHKDHPFWKLPAEDQSVLRGQDIITTYSNNFDPCQSYFRQTGINPSSIIETNFLDSMVLHLQTRSGIALMPGYMADYLPDDILMKDVLKVPMMEPSVAVYKQDSANPGIAAFMKLCRETYKDHIIKDNRHRLTSL